MLRKIAAGALALGLLLGAAATAMAAEELGPAVGTKAPEIGTPADQTGKTRDFASLLGEKGVILVFYRSAFW